MEKAYAAPQNTITGDQAHIKVATVKSGTLNVRAAASTSSALKGKLHAQETARAAAESGNWVFVANSRVSGWVSKEFVTLSTMSESAYRNMKNVAAVAVSTSSANGSSVVSLARQQLGKRYVGETVFHAGETTDSMGLMLEKSVTIRSDERSPAARLLVQRPLRRLPRLLLDPGCQS